LDLVVLPHAEAGDVRLRAVSTRIPGEDFETAVEGVDGTEADVSGLRVGEDYEVQVTALRGEDSATSQPYTFTVAGEVERWDTAHAGVGSGGEVIEHEDGSLEFDLLDSGAKIADSEDGFWYHYTEIDPQTENLTLDATFEVDDDSRTDSQPGCGVTAVDDCGPADTSARYFTSAGAMTAKYAFGVDGGGVPMFFVKGAGINVWRLSSWMRSCWGRRQGGAAAGFAGAGVRRLSRSEPWGRWAGSRRCRRGALRTAHRSGVWPGRSGLGCASSSL